MEVVDGSAEQDACEHDVSTCNQLVHILIVFIVHVLDPLDRLCLCLHYSFII